MSISPNEAVAAEIRAEMARRQRRHSDLVDILGVSQSGVSARLNGHQEMTVNEVVAIAGYLGCDPASWLVSATQAAS